MGFLKLSINVTKVDKAKLYKGKNGVYLNCVVYENDQPDQFDNTHVIKEDLSKEDRDAGKKPQIIGNGKWIEPQRREQKTTPRPQPKRDADLDPDDGSGVPF